MKDILGKFRAIGGGKDGVGKNILTEFIRSDNDSASRYGFYELTRACACQNPMAPF